MDLEDQRPRTVARGQVPALDVATIDLDVALLRLPKRDVGEDVRVECGQPRRAGSHPLRGGVEEPDIRGLGRGRAQVGRPHGPASARERHAVPARDVVATFGQALQPAVIDAQPPHLVRAVAGGRQVEPASVRRGQDGGRLAGGQVAAHPGARHQVMARRQVAAAIGLGVRAVGGEKPDVVAAPCAAGQAVAERRDRRAVGHPDRGDEGRQWTAGDRRDGARLDVDDVDVRPQHEVGVSTAVCTEGDPPAVGRPGGLAVCDRAIGQAAGLARRRVHQPEMRDAVIGEPGPVEHVVEAVDEAVVGRRGRAGSAASVRCRGGGRPRSASGRARTSRRPDACCRAPIRSLRCRAGGRSAGAPRRRPAAADGSGRNPRGPSYRVRPAPPRRSSGGPRGTRGSGHLARTGHGGHAARPASAACGSPPSHGTSQMAER